MRQYLFYAGTDNATYEQVVRGGNFIYQFVIGSICIEKVKVETAEKRGQCCANKIFLYSQGQVQYDNEAGSREDRYFFGFCGKV